MSQPFFIIGNPRSGTTLLRLMLNNHPQIIVPPECGFMLWLADKYQSEDFHATATVNNFLSDLEKTRKFETWNIDMHDLQNFIVNNKPTTYQDTCTLVYNFYSITVNKQAKLIGDKNNFYITYISKIKVLFPQAKFIFIVRDGRDVACSYRALTTKKIDSFYAPKLPFEIKDIAQEWVSNNQEIILNIGNSGKIVRYEDLIANPEQELCKLTELLGIPYDSQMLEYHIKNASEQQEPSEFLQWKEKTLLPPDAGNSGQYKDLLSSTEINKFNQIAAKELSFFGYQ